MFTTGQLEPGYLRFLKRRLREEFGFPGTPVHLEQRVREKGRRK
jgi:GTP-binding protein